MFLLDTDIIIYALKGRPAVVAHLEKNARSPMALAFNLTLISNNERHFRRIEGLKLENWASGAV